MQVGQLVTVKVIPGCFSIEMTVNQNTDACIVTRNHRYRHGDNDMSILDDIGSEEKTQLALLILRFANKALHSDDVLESVKKFSDRYHQEDNTLFGDLLSDF